MTSNPTPWSVIDREAEGDPPLRRRYTLSQIVDAEGHHYGPGGKRSNPVSAVLVVAEGDGLCGGGCSLNPTLHDVGEGALPTVKTRSGDPVVELPPDGPREHASVEELVLRRSTPHKQNSCLGREFAGDESLPAGGTGTPEARARFR